MGFSRFARPDTRTLTLDNGDTLLVKRRLNAAEARRRRALLEVPTLADAADVLTYLVDWSLKGDDAVSIAGGDPKVLADAIDALDEDVFDDIATAVSAHRAAMKAERDAEKKTEMTTGADPISASPSTAAGLLSGSVN